MLLLSLLKACAITLRRSPAVRKTKFRPNLSSNIKSRPWAAFFEFVEIIRRELRAGPLSTASSDQSPLHPKRQRTFAPSPEFESLPRVGYSDSCQNQRLDNSLIISLFPLIPPRLRFLHRSRI